MNKLRFALFGCVVAVALASNAAFADGYLSAGVSAGTLGVGPELGFRFGESFGVRGNVGYLRFSHDQDVDDIKYDGKLSLLSVGAMADWYPLHGGLRISAGARWNGSEIGLSARPNGSVTIGGTTYTAAEIGRLRGTIEANAVAPVLTVGYAGDISAGFTVGVELGVMYQGSPKLTNLRTDGLLANDPTFQVDLADEEERIENKVDNYQLWPVAQLLLIYRF